MKRLIYWLALIPVVFFFSCREDNFVPKRRGYFRVELPEHTYKQLQYNDFPYSFEYPTYGNVIRDTNFFGEMPENPYWINIDFPTIGGRIYISYKQITAKQPLSKLLEDAHFMSFYHTKRADYVQDYVFKSEYGVTGFLYEWGGDAASAYQFVATDSVKHFLRGALYFDVTPNADSLRPMNHFLKKDIEHLLYTIRWR